MSAATGPIYRKRKARKQKPHQQAVRSRELYAERMKKKGRSEWKNL